MIRVEIREECTDDRQAIRDLLTAAFPTSPEASLVDALRLAHRLRISLVADEDAIVAGHIAFSPVTMDGIEVGLGLAPLAVRAEFRRRGTGEMLVKAGLAQARERDTGMVVVLGEPDYYRRFGFEPARLRGLGSEYGGGAAFQVLALRAGGIPRTGGLIRYAPEFGGI